MLKKLLFLLMTGLVSGCSFLGTDESPYIYDEPGDGEYGDDEGDYEGDEGDEGDYGDSGDVHENSDDDSGGR